MASNPGQRNYHSVIVLLLVAALVTTLGLWARDRTRSMETSSETGGTALSPDEVIEWKMVTTWPKNFPGLGLAAENLSRYVEEMSGGRLTIRVYGAGEIVPAMEVFDAVSGGVADAGHGAA